MIRLREITGEDHLTEAFVIQYARAGGFPLDLGYVRRCRAYAFMDGAEMVGGFLLNVAPPFRSLNDMPEVERERVLGMLDLDETFEVMCFWIVPELRGSLSMMRFWAELLMVLWRFPRRDVLACTVSKALLEQYRRVPSCTVLYEGEIRTSKRVLDKFVFICRGKQGFAQGLVHETMRRVRKVLVPQAGKTAAGAVA